MGDFHHQPEIRLDHVITGVAITHFDPLGEVILFLDREKGSLGDFPEVKF